MTWAIIAWLYFAGLCASGFILAELIEGGHLRPVRTALFLIAWPIAIPFFVVWVIIR